MVHQPSGGARGQATDILIQVTIFKTIKFYNTAFPTCPLRSIIDKICIRLSRYFVSGRGDHKLEETTELDLCEAHWAGVAGDSRLTGEGQVHEPTAGPGIWPH